MEQADEWATQIGRGPLALRASVPQLVWLATTPWIGERLHGRHIATRLGPVTLGWQPAGAASAQPALTLHCEPCTLPLPGIMAAIVDESGNEIANGTFIFIDNYLGELNFLTQIDNFRIAGKAEAEKELIPIEKLKDYLNWREREFIDKHKGSKIQTNEDSFSLFEATLTNGFPLIATVNTDLLRWNKKASHPWISVLRIEYKGDDESGFPDNEDYEMLNAIEDEMLVDLKPEEGDLNIGRETAEHIREIYFASKDFRKISKILAETTRKYPQYNITFEIYKDKYWQSFERYGIH